MSSAENTSTDVAVVGGGLMGLAIAHRLSRSGAAVVLLDQHDLGQHQSGRNWGFARQQGRSPAELPLMRMANTLWRSLSEELESDTGWVMGGNLAVFDSENQENDYRRWLEIGQAAGVESQYLSPEGVLSLIPAWQRPCRGALFAATDGQADPETVVGAYTEACKREGVTVLPRERVTSLVREGDTIKGVRTENGYIRAGQVVVAAGGWSRGLLAGIGMDLPQNFVHGTVSLTTKQPSITDVTVWGPGFSFRQRKDGRFVCATGGGGLVDIGLDTLAQSRLFIGAFKKNWKRFKLRPGRQIPHEIRAAISGQKISSVGPPIPRVDRHQSSLALKRLKGTIKGIGDIQIERTWAGIIDSTPDGLPVIDTLPEIGGLTVATGFSGHGYGLVPAVGHVVTDLIMGHKPVCDVSAMRLSRFSAGDYVPPNAIL